MQVSKILIGSCLVAAITTGGLAGCGSTATSKGASSGAIVGGLMDGWRGAAVGAIIGGGVGYAVDSTDKKKAERRQSERRGAAREEARSFRPPNSLTGSTWRVVSLVDDEEKVPDFDSMVLSFPTDTKATTLILWADGRAETFSESYMVLDNALVFRGDDYVTNAKFNIDGERMVLVTPTRRAVFEEVGAGV